MASSQNNIFSNSSSSKKKSELNADYLIQQLSKYAQQHKIKTWCLAYSGGVDSQVLLHLLHLTQLKVSAVYIDHCLQAQSADWAEHCRQQCEVLKIPFQVIRVDGRATQGESPEAAARAARYGALKSLIQTDSCLLTAQHQDDQTETVLLQLLRGAGAAGLAGMPDIAKFGEGWHARPLLDISQKNILNYAQTNQLSWVEDPTNQHVNIDRNYLRHSVIPDVIERWPALNKTLSVFAQQQAENADLLNQLAQQDLELVLCDEQSVLEINQLNKMADARLRNVLRYWFKTIKSPLPSRAVLEQIVQQIKTTSHDSALRVSWAGYEVRRFRDRLYWLKKIKHDASQEYNCDVNEILFLSSIDKHLRFKKVKTNEKNILFVLKALVNDKVISVRFRQGGEKIKPAGRNASHDLKSLFQEASVPTWQRDRVPLLFIGNDLVAVVGYWLADDYAQKGEGFLPVSE